MNPAEDTLIIAKPTTEGMCCKILVRLQDSELEIELTTEGAEALGMTLLGMVELAESQKEGMN